MLCRSFRMFFPLRFAYFPLCTNLHYLIRVLPQLQTRRMSTDQYNMPILSSEEENFVDELKEAIEVTINELHLLPDIEIRTVVADADLTFQPALVSIGPVFKDEGIANIELKEKLKVAYLNAFLTRTKINLETCVRKIKGWDTRIRKFYGNRLHEDRYPKFSILQSLRLRAFHSRNYDGTTVYDIDPEDHVTYDILSQPSDRRRLLFWEMILLDTCFIIEVIWRYTSTRVQAEADYLSHPRIMLDARRDMIILHNQLPFFVLEGLFDLGFPSYAGTDRSFINLAIIYLSEFMLFADSSQATERIQRLQQPYEIKDFVDLLRICHAPLVPRLPPTDVTKLVSMRRASQLEEAGMTIKPPARSTNSSVCSIRYSTGRLEIPKLKINDKSELVLRNLIARESREHQYESFIIDYLHFMDGIIDTNKDVDILIKHEVIENFLSDSKAVAALFNSITAEAPLFTPNYYYYGICGKLNAYCKVRRHRWRATLKRDYCSSPMMVASTIAAIILLILTLIQTVCSILSLV